MKDEPTLKNKLSPLIQGQLPDFLQQEEHSTYAHFVRDFYQFLESARMKFSFTTNYLIQEPETKAYILSENGILGAAEDRIVLEDSTEFLTNETIKGQTSGAEAKVIAEDVRNSAIYITSNQRFERDENIVGLTSGATAKLTEYKANPVQNIQQLLEYADIDNTVWEYFDQFREAFMNVIPSTLANGVSKRNLIKNINDLYSAKGTREGHKLFMRLLLNENANIFYPNKNMLKVSDGDWKKLVKIRCTSQGQGTSGEALNQVITGRTSGATAVVDGTSTFQQGINSISEFEVENVKGTFQNGEIIDVISNEKDVKISFIVKTIITDATIENAGILHSQSEALVIDSDKGNGFADVLVDSIKEGSVSDVHIQTAGSNYEVGDIIQFSGGGGIAPAQGVVTATGGGFELEDGTGVLLREFGTLFSEEAFNIALEDTELSDGPYYVFGTANYNQLGAGLTGYFYPLYLSQAGAGGASSSHGHTYVEYPGITFYMPAGQLNHGRGSLPSTPTYLAWPPTEQDKIIFDRTDSIGTDAGDRIQTNEIQVSLDAIATDNDKLVLEAGSFSTVSEATEINKVFIKNKGQGYKALPTVSVASTDGSGAKLLALTNDIGAAGSLRINDAGFDYDTNDLPDARFRAHFIIKDVTGSFVVGNNLTTHTGQVKSWNPTTQQLDLTFEDIVKFNLEQSSAFNIPFVLEGGTTALNENNILMEDVQDVPLTSEDNLVFDGTKVTQPPVRTVNVVVKYENNKFTIDGVSQRSMKLKEGFTYYFDLSHPSLYDETDTKRHPLRFSETEYGTHGGGTEYTTGVTKSQFTVAIGTTGAFIQITIATNAPTLFYYDENFENIGGKIQTDKVEQLIADVNDNIILNGSGVNKFKMLFEGGQGENPLLGIAFEDDSGVVTLENSQLFPIQDEDDKILLDGIVESRTSFILNETSGKPMRNEDFGNTLLTEAGERIIDETQNSTSIGDSIVLDGNDSNSNNAGQFLINEEGIDFSGNNVVIQDSGGARGTVILSNIGRGSVSAGLTQETDGTYVTVDSLLNEDLIRIQDSYYYQQFSYEVQVGQSTATYLNELKKAVHPAGFAPFGKVSVASFISMAIRNAGIDEGLDDNFSPILASTFEILFDEVINRRHAILPVTARVGTRDNSIILDGTDGSSTNAGDNIVFEDGTVSVLGSGGRLKSEDAHAPGNKELVFVPTYKVTIQSQARGR